MGNSSRIGAITVLAALLGACDGGETDVTPTDTDTGTPPVNDPDNDGDGFTIGQGDCDDRNRFVFPGAVEVCDGIDTDCNGDDTDESGVWFQPMQVAPVDRTADFQAGTAKKPYAFVLDEPGVLSVCAGTWFTTIEIAAEGDVRINGAAGREYSVLDGGGVVPGIVLRNQAAVLGIQGLTLQNFVSDKEGLGSAIICDGQDAQAQVEAQQVSFIDNTATVAGGSVAVVDGCAMQLQSAEFQGGSAPVGGQLAISDASIDMLEARFENGTATLGGGAAAVGSEITPFNDNDSVLRCRDCEFDGNRATDPKNKKSTAGGGAIWVRGNALLQTQRVDFSNNEADLAGGAVLIQSLEFDEAEAAFSETTFDGNLAAGKDNDVSIPVLKEDYIFGGSTSAMCDETNGCIEP